MTELQMALLLNAVAGSNLSDQHKELLGEVIDYYCEEVAPDEPESLSMEATRLMVNSIHLMPEAEKQKVREALK